MKIKEAQFTWGPLARGVYIALLMLSPLVGIFLWQWAGYYVLFLLFLGLFLRPLLEVTGLYHLCSWALHELGEKHWEKTTRERRREIARMERDQKYKHRHQKDPRLPPNW